MVNWKYLSLKYAFAFWNSRKFLRILLITGVWAVIYTWYIISAGYREGIEFPVLSIEHLHHCLLPKHSYNVWRSQIAHQTVTAGDFNCSCRIPSRVELASLHIATGYRGSGLAEYGRDLNYELPHMGSSSRVTINRSHSEWLRNSLDAADAYT